MKLKRYFILGILVICLILTACGNSKDNLTATTMKLLGYEGTVSLEADGKSLSLRDDMQLHNGNAIATDKKAMLTSALMIPRRSDSKNKAGQNSTKTTNI